MPYFVNICGEIKCRSPDSIDCCSKVLKRYHLAYKISQSTIMIESKLHVTEFFNEDGFKHHLLEKFRKHGEAHINIQEVTTNEDSDRLL